MSLKNVFKIKESVYHQHWTSSGQRWNVGMLYDYAKSVTEPEDIPLDSLKKQFERTNVDEEKWSKEFIERCNNTNMDYPILAVLDRKNRLWIADGNHRYGRAVMAGDETISGYVVSESDLPEKALEPAPKEEDTSSHTADD
jgi:hypothetical protein